LAYHISAGWPSPIDSPKAVVLAGFGYPNLMLLLYRLRGECQPPILAFSKLILTFFVFVLNYQNISYILLIGGR
jgi:hypothetical protein